MKDHYETLEVPPDASQATIREQYLFLIQAWHPDKFSNPAQKAKAEEKSKAINAAYDVLKHPQKRAEYDRKRAAGSSLFSEEQAKQQAEEDRRRQAEEERRRHAAEQRRGQAEGRRWGEPVREEPRRVYEEPSQKEAAGEPQRPFEEARRKREEAEARVKIRELVEHARRGRSQSKRPPVEGSRSAENPIRVLLADYLAERRVSLRAGAGEAADISICGEASTGLEAITQFNALKPDVAIMYLNMPEIDGIAATKIICERHPGARVMMMTAESGADTIRRSMLAGACDYLLMPFTAEELITAIRQAAV